MKQIFIAWLFCTVAFLPGRGQVNYVNTRQGTNSRYEFSYGNTYPATALPFGMHTWTPQTGKNGDGWKYQYFVHTIRGFQQSHQCSSWVNDYAVFSLFPEADKLVVNEDERAAAFKHENEIAQPGYYKVTFDNGIKTEFSPTERGAHFRFTFPTKKSILLLDGYTKMSQVKIDPVNRKITGYVNNARWVPQSFRNYFEITFDKPFKAYGTWENKQNTVKANESEAAGEGVGAYIDFGNARQIEAKVASSYISAEQATLTLQREVKGKFEDTHAAADKVWNTLLSRMKVEGGTEEQKATFYSCLYHANLFSHQFFEYDKDGNPYYYSPYDGKIYQGYMYTDNGFWDTFRGQFPLNTIMHPAMEGRYAQALLDAQEQCGWFPAWSFPGETGGMLGNHAISLLADAWVKGIRTFDLEKALKAYFHEATNKGPWGSANGRPGFKEYYEMGYCPYSEKTLGASSWTLEFAYDDFCGYQLAKMTNQPFYENVFSRQMYNYRNLYDPATGFMRAKDAAGNWITPFDPLDWGGPYTEGNAWHWTWSVFHDVQGLINLMGGEQQFTNKIDSVFSVPGTIKVGGYGQVIHEMTEMAAFKMGQYAQGNEPIHHLVYLYNYAGQPWKTQWHVRQIMQNMYNATENGYPGDEDQGQMSSWYVLSAAGFYSVCPGTDQYVIGSPLFPKMTISLENGRSFIVEAENNSPENVYIQSATLNGVPYEHNFITHNAIMNGGTLHLVMGSKPNYLRGIKAADRPFSLTSAGSWPLGPFTRPGGVNPLISPDSTTSFRDPMTGELVGWESNDTFNPGAVLKDGKICILYRAEDRSGKGIGMRTSRLGLATSEDGIHVISRSKTPVLFPDNDNAKEFEWKGGCEDPRVAVTKDGTYLVLYTEWNNKVPRLGAALSKDLIHWEKKGPVFKGAFRDIASKSASILTEVDNGQLVISKVNGKYWMYWGEYHVYAATSDNLYEWTPLTTPDGKLKELMSPRKGYFDSDLTECGPPAVKTPQGIVLLYNGKNSATNGDKRYTAKTYAAGQALFDLQNPEHLLDRLDQPFLVPQEAFEKSGQYPAGTVFIEGLVLFRNKWFLYYGCADSRVAVAVADKKE